MQLIPCEDMNLMSNTRRAFTLIELLVVIAIIAILAAILFPVFAQAKLAAKKTADLSQVKQLALATVLYQNDNDDYFPHLAETDPNFATYPANVSMWSSVKVVGQYVKSPNMFLSPADNRFNFSPGDATYAGMPADRPHVQMSYLANAFSAWNPARLNFGISNGRGLFTVDPNFSGDSISPVTSSTEISNPTNVIMFSNGLKEYYGDFYGLASFGFEGCIDTETDWCFLFKGVYDEFIPDLIRLAAPGDPLYPAWRKYSGRSNFVMADTSARSLAPTQVDDAKHWIISAPDN
jgi:prepilin-type N-terminal cleavage/methylation domain-containing protein